MPEASSNRPAGGPGRDDSSPVPLLRDRSFHAFTATQFLGAFNDNVFKQMILLVAIDASTSGGGQLQALASALFALPFILFSGVAGVLSDRFGKSGIIVAMKLGEILVMGLALLALSLMSLPFLFATLFLMASQSAFFGPAKYGILPEMLCERDLSPANGVVAMTTFLAIILGMATAGFLRDFFGEKTLGPGAILVGLAVLGTVTALGIRRLPPARPGLTMGRNPFGELIPTLREIFCNGPMRTAALAYSFFWFLGGVVQQTMNEYGRRLMDLNNTQTSLLLVTLSAGLGMGFLIGGMLSRRRVRCDLCRVGLYGMILTLALLSVAHRWLPLTHAVLFGLGASAGLFALPLQTFVQIWAPEGRKGRVIAAVNFLTFVFIFGSAAVYGVLTLLVPSAAYIPLVLAVGASGLGFLFVPRLGMLQEALGSGKSGG